MSFFGLGSSDPLAAFGKASSNDITSESYPLKLANSVATDISNMATFANSKGSFSANSQGVVASGSSATTKSQLLFGLDFGKDEPNWAAFAVQHYLESILTSPLLVVETLTDVQYQKRIDATNEDDFSTDYETVHPGSSGSRVIPLHLPRMHSGISSNLRLIADSELEGVSGLFKGHVTDFVFRASFSIIQPGIEEFMNDMLDVFEDVNPTTSILSHAITGALLSPIETARTRLIVQATGSSRRKYFGPIHVLHNMANEERPTTFSTAFSTLYQPRILLPSVLVHTAGSFVRFFSSRIIQEELGLDPAFSPIMYRLATLGFLALEAAIVTPLEMARKRLQVQRIDAFRRSPNPVASPNSSKSQTFESVVATSSTPYTGLFNCIYSIIFEEGGRRPISIKSKKNLNLSASDWQDIYGGGGSHSGPQKQSGGIWTSMVNFSKGISTLYRGFWARYATTIVLYVSNEISRDDNF
ncbi:hypothetical protein BATDEDRAFT_35418 [Batrachochytrium dendrobatidis JAM81]|uniref:Mitochondrial carrier n=2 Tax=Batrachochytrium dendrobatidis TaxID=109871 RepID=F4P600_BATDJ|nr:uncharacterized protein BATDEDRAFT_35418 [Batrachochytrium dendrobatidis JAM81]EGF79516.1 hypothetical protein BATDEDRAFT_35418 [Batrachochytrium dendrobatidis JAM81]KAJ8322889.1 hypothetical protein O5D80_008412 [Batrachochytrium dendrobatidis]KAK5665791.1 hypothetical protein QVD99_007425 [Batrachochytrium dendrobatidis]OAJ42729.1 hypothetical protein BDEG_26148 [Batrachochytrium dendrobatidis JEL423]|eukprot:XP_006679993.1 hypothetical protein BATDEDRAFT_35418 [Batrachochytrium dendrobatidis JAM81]